MSFNKNGAKTSTCTDLIFTNIPAVSRAIGCRYHNLIAISRETKMPKAGDRIIQRQSFQKFNPDLCLTGSNLQWADDCDQQDDYCLNIYG